MKPKSTVHLTIALIAVMIGVGVGVGRADITYDVDQTVASPAGSATVAGTITTDGTIGTITAADITSFNLTLSDTSGDSFNYTSHVFSMGDDITATSTELLFAYTGGPDVGYLLFQPTYGNSETYFCLATLGNLPLCYQGESIVPVFSLDMTSGYDELITGDQVFATVPGTAPEPPTVGLMLMGLGLLGLVRKRIIPAFR